MSARKKHSGAGSDKDARQDWLDAATVFHEHAAEYDGWFENNPVFAMELAALQSLSAPVLGPKLEIGVGPGRFAERLGVSLGFDPARAPLQLAAGRGIACCQAFGEELPVRDRSIGTIFLLLTLCFAAKPRKMLEESCRSLRKGGYLVIGMIPAGSQWGKNLAVKKREGHLFYRHARLYTIKTVMQWLAGMHMNIMEYRSTLYQGPAAIEKIEAPMNMLDEEAGFVVIVARKDNG